MSYRAMMEFATEPPAGNALRFITREEADAYGKDLFYRWTMPTGYHVEESPDAPTHAWIPGDGLQRLAPIYRCCDPDCPGSSVPASEMPHRGCRQ